MCWQIKVILSVSFSARLTKAVSFNSGLRTLRIRYASYRGIRGVAMGQARQAVAWGPVFWGGPRQLTIWTIGYVIINNIHVTWSNISASPPRGPPLAFRWMCVLFPRDASAAVSKLAQHLLTLLLGYLKNQKDLSIWQPKRKKGGKEETWQR